MTDYRVNKPRVGDTCQASELGLKGRALRTWAACPDCRAKNTLLVRQLEDKSIPSQAESNFGRCRDLTGDTLQYEGEEKVHPSEKSGITMRSLRGNRQPLGGASVEQFTDKLTANSGKPKLGGEHGNPELNGGSNAP